MTNHPSDVLTSRRAALGAIALSSLMALESCQSGGSASRRAATSPSGAASRPGSTENAPHVTSTSDGDLPSKEAILTEFGGRTPKAWGLNLPGEIVSVPAANKAVALTFDACGGPGGSGYDENLITLLRKYHVKATLNFNARWITENEGVAKELASDPLFRIANHGTRHQPLSVSGRSAYGLKGTANLGALYDEVVSAHDWIAHHCPGKPIYFRSGTAYSDDIGVAVCARVGMPFLGYTLNGDGGTTFTAAQVRSALLGVSAGDVIISHMNHPERGTFPGYRDALPQLLDQGFTFTHLTKA